MRQNIYSLDVRKNPTKQKSPQKNSNKNQPTNQNPTKTIPPTNHKQKIANMPKQTDPQKNVIVNHYSLK